MQGFEDRLAGGLRCSEVLVLLSDYLDGELQQREVAGIQAHVAECQQCARFGASFAAAVEAFRSGLREPEPLEEAVAQRLQERLAGIA